MLLHGVTARIRLGTILAGPSSFQVAASDVPPDSASLHVLIATLPEAYNGFLVGSIHTMKVAEMQAKFTFVMRNGMVTPFTIFNPCTFRKGRWSKDDERL